MRSAAKYVWIILIVAFVGGFLLVETSGLLNRDVITSNTSIAEVNGEDILATDYFRAVQVREQQESQRLGRGLSLDERQQLEQAVFDDLVNDRLVRQELDRRGIQVSDAEIIQAAQTSPPPELLQNPELQTEGQFDPDKYRRFLANPAAKAQGLLQYLEQYYRSEIPKQKLYSQVASDVYLSDARLWAMWQDSHDSARVTFAAFRPELIPDSAVKISDAEVSAYYERNRKSFERPGRAVVSVVSIPRAVTGEDSVAARERAAALRQEIVGGAKFEDVARRESADSGSGAQGGSLGKGPKGRFVAEFENAAFALPVGEVSQPVLTPFGYHLIKVDARQGDTLDVRHILVRIGQSDSSAARTDRVADALAKDAAAAEANEGVRRFDAAAAKYQLQKSQVVAIENEPLSVSGRYVPSVSAWAFGGASVGETSDLYDSPDAYYLARLDSLTPGGTPPVAEVREEIRRRLAREKKLEQLVPRAEAFAKAAREKGFEATAQATPGVELGTTPMFTRTSLVPGLGQFTAAHGAAFAVPVGQIGAPVVSRDAVVVLRVDQRVNADKGAWTAQKSAQRQQATQVARQQRVREYLTGLREQAKLEDNRKEVVAAQRRQAAS
ncbi:peptidyl-prolyl cis-trans isomerase [Roseisolibacter sp. H3M3-2]|uniref:peptidyl-prolyl cis-trans isomerase n=1 Tax=Roseisolibacter sp. H3M3-2 TaxID=3031323 RepID=UPI0023DAFDB8|nr:peptidyl-prolyl cis-trans isomerase [Roseisolibacter sp. H3M3-2]